MGLQSIQIDGTPATFATSREKEWKSILAALVPRPSLDGKEAGITMRFLLPTLAPQGQPLDVDNLAEPVFVVIVRQSGWFERSKPRIRWWSASKEVGTPHGCSLTISQDPTPAIPITPPTYSDLYAGVLPRSATSPEVATWAAEVVRRRPQACPSTCALHLGFGSPSVNIGDISTGVVKSFMDCLYPFFGGSAGAPEDHRVSHLIVQKAVHGVASDAVKVVLWYHDHDADIAVGPGTSRELAPLEGRAMHNPCRPGTAKWIVCEGALQQKTVVDVQAELNRLKPGSGARLSEYMSDVRGENNLDVRIDDIKLVCHGQLRK